LQTRLAWHVNGEPSGSPPVVELKPISTTSLMGRTIWRKMTKTFNR
jgi:hypothetical protein